MTVRDGPQQQISPKHLDNDQGRPLDQTHQSNQKAKKTANDVR